MRKSQIQSEVLRYILIGVVSFLIITFSILLMRSCGEKRREAELIDFENEIGSSIEVIATRANSVDRFTYPVPEGVELVCFLDLKRKTEILETPLAEKYPFIKDSLQTNTKQNIFYIKGDSLKDTDYQKDLCFQSSPYYQCVTISYGTIDMYLQGLGKCATIFTNSSGWISNNLRNSDKYVYDGFMIEAEENNDNYREILRIVPIAFVNSRNATYKTYPYIVYYGTITDSSIDNLMQEKSISSLVLFDNEAYNYQGSNTVVKDSSDNFLDYWTTIYDVTITGMDNYNGALIASLFAAFTNTPLIFIDNSNLESYKGLLNGKTVNVVDQDKIDVNVINYIEQNSQPRYFDSDALRILTYNKILDLESGIIIP